MPEIQDIGKFLSILAANCPPGQLVEIGTSAGYSTMWLALAAKERGVKVKTFELLEPKIRMAKETFRQAGINDFVELIEGDVLVNIRQTENVSFCLIEYFRMDFESANGPSYLITRRPCSFFVC
ncbi:MAG: class I SAM-dependent methyltransferase [Spirochaetia bacterium]